MEVGPPADIGAGEFKFGNNRRPEQPTLFFRALDEFVKLFVKFVYWRSRCIQLTHVELFSSQNK